MPLGDRTGPRGYGPMTGRGLGYCAGFSSPGFTKGPGMGLGRGFGRGFGRGSGRGFGRGQGYGRGFGRGYGYDPDPYFREPVGYGYYPPPPIREPVYPDYSPEPKEEVSYLKRMSEGLEKELKAIKDRITELSKKED